MEKILIKYHNGKNPLVNWRFKSEDDIVVHQYNTLKGDECQVYCDGSYRLYNGVEICGYGVVILEEGMVQVKESGFSIDKYFAIKGSLGSEVLAFIKGLDAAPSRGYSKINMCYDSYGLYQAIKRRKITHIIMDRLIKKVEETCRVAELKLVKVKAHIGDLRNNLSDKLVKMGRLKGEDYVEKELKKEIREG